MPDLTAELRLGGVCDIVAAGEVVGEVGDRLGDATAEPDARDVPAAGEMIVEGVAVRIGMGSQACCVVWRIEGLVRGRRRLGQVVLMAATLTLS